jgi:hypothetical protein
VFMPVEAFGKLNESLLDAGKAAFANPRNGVDIAQIGREYASFGNPRLP